MTFRQICRICGHEFEAIEQWHGPRKYCSKRCAGLAVGGKNSKNLVGQKFGRLTVISVYDKRSNGVLRWLCQCDCGGTAIVQTGHLTCGETKSCGCYMIDRTREANATHGLSQTPFYKYWRKRMRRDADRTWTIEMDQLIRNVQPSCVICSSSDELQMDHVVPFIKGGRLEPGNAVVLCKYHNLAKNDSDLSDLPLDWRERIERTALEFAEVWTKGAAE